MQPDSSGFYISLHFKLEPTNVKPMDLSTSKSICLPQNLPASINTPMTIKATAATRLIHSSGK